jgi:NADPH:quinone reductase-like Zn-dependent oxidoreductase
MKAAAYHRNGEPDVLAYQDVADPEVGPATVLIRVAHAALQGGDLLNRRGTPPPGDTPHVVGYQAAGVIKVVGAGVVGLRQASPSPGAMPNCSQSRAIMPIRCPMGLTCRSPRRCRSSLAPRMTGCSNMAG